MRLGDLVYLSIRPEKFRITRDRRTKTALHNSSRQGGGRDLPRHSHPVLGACSGLTHRGLSAAFRFLLDEKPITWNDEVWVRWHSDDGFMIERYSERDQELGNWDRHLFPKRK